MHNDKTVQLFNYRDTIICQVGVTKNSRQLEFPCLYVKE